MLELPCPAVSALEACASSLLVTRVKELAFCLVARKNGELPEQNDWRWLWKKSQKLAHVGRYFLNFLSAVKLR